MIINLEEVQNLLSKLTALISEESNLLTRDDKMAMQRLYNIEYYLSSNADYDATYNLNSLKEAFNNCSAEVKEILMPFLSHYELHS